MRRSAAPSQSRSSSLFRPPVLNRISAPRASCAAHQPLNSKPPDSGNAVVKYFTAIWCKQTSRKHKKYEDDAFLIIRPKDRLAILKGPDGKELSRGSGLPVTQLVDVASGSDISFGGKEVQVLEEISKSQYQASVHNLEAPSENSEDQVVAKPSVVKSKVIDQTVFKPFAAPTRFGVKLNPVPKKPLSTSDLSQANFDSLVLPRPPFQLDDFSVDEIKDVIVDNHLAKQLRPHQREGVIFLYRCLLGFNENDCYGAILADEMGLGKTLQTITLIWTMLKQGPWSGKPLIKRALILAPSSLIGNWQAEFKKWLGSERIQTFGVDANNRLGEYIKYPYQPVLIMSYEMFVKNFDSLQRIKFDLIVCDEGHRLKNEKVRASALLSKMETEKRIVLTGTPLQNDLKEFYAIACTVNPSIFGTTQEFCRTYENPILRSKQPDASVEEIEEGEIRMEELNKISSQFILRRTQDLLKNYLPPKSELILFCRPSDLQNILYESAVEDMGQNLSMDASCILSKILQLRKICNHPALSDFGTENVPPHLMEMSLEEQGGKLAVVSYVLHDLRSQGGEKIVLVSISTQVLDLLEELCGFYNYPCLRLDGSTPAAQRQNIVKRFNSKLGDDFVLLLSSKAGGTGLNLIGASKILMYDMDWNPAHDIQAMARVWRDGQRKPVIVYRLVTTGTIEEKIFQRQITKQGLGGGLMDDTSKASKFHFTKEELKDLFSFDPGSICLTHDLLNCECTGEEVKNVDSSKRDKRSCQLGGSEAREGNSIQDLLDWTHLDPSKAPESLSMNMCLHNALCNITFVMKKFHS